MTWHKVHRKTSSNWSAPKSQFSSSTFGSKHPEVQKSPFALRPFAPVEQKVTKEDIAANEFQENKFEATRLKIQAKYNTITPSGQEQLNLLQAKMENYWVQRKEIAQRRPGSNFANLSAAPSEPIQAKLTVGAAGDKYEQEADAIASRVMSMPDAAVQREVAPEQTDEEVQTKPLAAAITPLVQREAMPEEEEVQAKSLNASIQRDNFSEKEEVQAKLSTVDGGDRSHLQLKSDAIQTGGNIESQLNSSKGGGSPLGDEVRGFMEPRFGHDFSQVRVHTGGDAVQMNRELGAQAFAHGSDIYFGVGKVPGNNELTAHELTHVVQQNYASDSIQRALQSPRFSETTELESAHDDKKHLKKGSNGLSVRILQQALLDAGYPLPKYGVDGIFGNETEAAVKAFQKAHGLKDDGIVGPKTMQALDTSFLDHGSMASIPQSQVPSTAPTEGVEWNSGAVPPELLKGTRTLTAEEKAEVERRRTTEVQAPKGGTLPDFKMNIPTHPDSYEKRVEDTTNQTIDWQYNELAKGKAADRKDPDKLYKWDVIEKVAAISKRETDRVFGNYANGKPFKAGLNLFDAWEEKEKQFAAGGAKYEQDKVEWRVQKIFGGDIGEIDREHGAVQSRATEKGILDNIMNRIIAKRRSELIEIHKGWPGFADEGKVYLQRFVSSDAAQNRNAMWDNFQTVVHEYIHTLEHSKHQAYREGLGELKGGKTYREGMTEYFTKVVLESTTYDDQLRKDVEGTYHDPAIKHPIPQYSGYDEAKNAEAVVGVVGIRNAMAAFFTGRIDLIGG